MRARSRASLREMYPRVWAMHRAVNPKPVAATLAAVLLSVVRTLQRSFTRPGCGSACSQKNWKLAFWRSSRNWSSCGERLEVENSGEMAADCAAAGGGVSGAVSQGTQEAACR